MTQLVKYSAETMRILMDPWTQSSFPITGLFTQYRESLKISTYFKTEQFYFEIVNKDHLTGFKILG